MSTGMDLKIALGLEDFEEVRIARVITSSKKILNVYYDSFRPSRPITNSRVKKPYRVATVWNGKDLENGENKHTIMTPLMDIEDYNGSTSNALIIPIDLAGSIRIDPDMFSRVFEGVDKLKHTIPTTIHFEGKLDEFLQMNDITRNLGMSNFTKDFRVERSKIMGAESKVAKLVDININTEKDFVTFFWLTETTDKYPDDHKFKEVDPESKKLKNNVGKTYTVSLMITEFFQWLDTFNVEDKITRKDIKDILEVANIKFFSTDPSFHYQGANFNASAVEASTKPTTIAPKVWNQPHLHGDGNNFLSKHMVGIFNSMPFWSNAMAQMLTSRLQTRNLI